MRRVRVGRTGETVFVLLCIRTAMGKMTRSIRRFAKMIRSIPGGDEGSDAHGKNSPGGANPTAKMYRFQSYPVILYDEY